MFGVCEGLPVQAFCFIIGVYYSPIFNIDCKKLLFMSHVRKILVVDDHFETLAVTRAMLENSDSAYWVRTVPSGEEGMLELRQAGYDVLITDVRLPGISGIELVRQLRRTQPDLPVIMMTGYASEKGKREAMALGVVQYLMKPLEIEVLLTAVHTALLHQPQPTIVASPKKPAVPAPSPVPNPLYQRLDMLRTETGALGLLFVQMDGSVVAKVGEMSGLQWDKIALPLARMMRSSVELAEAVASEENFTLQYHDLTPFKLTSATVGREHFLTLVFEPDPRRSRIGTVWLFVQRATADLLRLLAVPSKGVVPAVEPVPDEVVAVVIEAERVEEPPSPAEPELDVVELGALLGLSLDETAVPDDLDSFWSQAMDETEVKKEGMTMAEAQRRGILPSGLDFGDDPKK